MITKLWHLEKFLFSRKMSVPNRHDLLSPAYLHRTPGGNWHWSVAAQSICSGDFLSQIYNGRVFRNIAVQFLSRTLWRETSKRISSGSAGRGRLSNRCRSASERTI